MESKYLVTGLPRTRSAWLAAVLSTSALPCVHSRMDTFLVSYDHGLSDPCAAFNRPYASVAEFKNKPVVFIERDLAEVQFSFDKFLATQNIPPLSSAAWALGVKNVLRFRESAPHSLIIRYADLDNSYIVKWLASYLGVSLSLEYIEHMQLLHIEQSEKCLAYAHSAN